MFPAFPLFLLGSQFLLERSRMQSHDTREPYGLARRHVGGIADPLTCPGVDIDTFEQNCRADIFPDMWNHWRLLKSTSDGVTASSPEYEQDAANQARALLTKIQGEGAIRHVDVRIGGEANPWDTPVIQDRNSICAQPMFLEPSTYVPAYLQIYVRFVYRGPALHIPWPARKVSNVGLGIGIGSNCPIGANWLLDAVFAPDQNDVPDSETDSPLPPTVDPNNAIDKTDLPSMPALELGALVLLGIVGAVAIGYAARSFR